MSDAWNLTEAELKNLEERANDPETDRAELARDVQNLVEVVRLTGQQRHRIGFESPCQRCGDPRSHRTRIGGDVGIVTWLCDDCANEWDDYCYSRRNSWVLYEKSLARVRAEIAVGRDPCEAIDIMIPVIETLRREARAFLAGKRAASGTVGNVVAGILPEIRGE